MPIGENSHNAEEPFLCHLKTALKSVRKSCFSLYQSWKVVETLNLAIGLYIQSFALIRVVGLFKQKKLYKSDKKNEKFVRSYTKSGADLGGAAGGGHPFSGIRAPGDTKGPPFILFQKSIFGRPTLKIF